MNDAYTERAILETISWLIPTVLGILAFLLKRPREWLLALPRRLRARRAARKAARAEMTALPGEVRRALDRTEQMARERTAAEAALADDKTRTTQQFDAIGKQLQSLPGMESAIQGVHQSVNMLHLRLGARANHSRLAECDFAPDFSMTNVNTTLARRLGVGKAELLGFGYVGFLYYEDRSSLRMEWAQCRDENRPLQRTLRWVRQADGVLLNMRWTLQPIPEPPATPIQQWMGIGEFDDDEDGE